MSDYSIGSVTNMRTAETAAVPAGPVTATGAIPSLQGRVEQTAAKQGAQAPDQVELTAQSQVALKQNDQKKSADTQAKSDLPISNKTGNLTIRFSVDEKTKDVTLFIIDKASKRVLRSIPSEDLNKMQAGDLLQLLA